MNKQKKYSILVKNISYVFSGNVINGIVNFTLLIVLTRWLSVEDYGIFSFFWTMIIVISAIYEFGLDKSFLKQFGQQESFKQKNTTISIYNNLRVISLLILMISYSFLELTGALNSILSNVERSMILLGSILFIIFYHSLIFFQIDNNLKLYSLHLVFPNMFRLILILGIFWLAQSKDSSLLIFNLEVAILLALFLSALTTQFKKENRIRFSFKESFSFLETKPLLVGSIIFGITGIINKTGMRVDNVLIYFTLGEKGVGLFNAANSLALIFPMLTTAILTVFYREFSLKKSQKNKHIQLIKKYQKIVLIPLVVSLFLLLIWSKDIIIFLLGHKYQVTASIFQVLLLPYLGGLLFTPLESFFYSYSQKFIITVKISQFIIGLLLTFLFIKNYGISGLGYSQLTTRSLGWIAYSTKIRSFKYA